MARPSRERASSMSLSLTIIFDPRPSTLEPRSSTLDVARRGSLVRERVGDRPRLVNRQVAEMRTSAGVGLSCRVNAQRRQTEPAVEWRLMDFNGLDFIDRHDVRRAPYPTASRAKIALAQRVAQVPVIREADQVDQR